MAGIAERKMTSDHYDGTKAYNGLIRTQKNPYDEKSNKAIKIFKHDVASVYKLKGGKVNENSMDKCD